MTREENPAAWAYEVLGLNQDATEEEMRAAYVRGLREFPPDRAPEQFQKLREAYDYLRDPEVRFRGIMSAVIPRQMLASWLADQPSQRRHTGPGPWINAMKKGAK